MIKKFLFKRNISNLISYGFDAIFLDTEIVVKPCSIKGLLYIPTKKNGFGLPDSRAKIVDSLPLHDVKPIEAMPQYRFIFDRFVRGMSWENTGAYDHQLKRIKQAARAVAGCSSLADIISRYEALDELYDQLSKGQNLRNTEYLLHIDSDLNVYAGGGNGAHRLAIQFVTGRAFRGVPGHVEINALSKLRSIRYRL